MDLKSPRNPILFLAIGVLAFEVILAVELTLHGLLYERGEVTNWPAVIPWAIWIYFAAGLLLGGLGFVLFALIGRWMFAKRVFREGWISFLAFAVCFLPTYVIGFLVNRKTFPAILEKPALTKNVLLAAAFLTVFALLHWRLGRLDAAKMKRAARAIAVAFLVILGLGSVSLLALAILGREGPSVKPASDSRPEKDLNVLLITVDTLRARSLHCYGNERIRTPRIDALARSGVMFLNAFTPIPETDQSHASILTGNYPIRHGVMHNGWKLDPGNLTLAEILQQNGFRTGAAVSVEHLGSSFGFSQGFDGYYNNSEFFDRYYHLGRSRDSFLSIFFLAKSSVVRMATGLKMDLHQRPANETLKDAFAWLEENKDRPFFFWLHLFDPHAPYAPPKKYRGLYSDETVPFPATKIKRSRVLRWVNDYDGEVTFVDDQLGRLFDYLKDENLYRKTLIVLTSDHGEALGEHDLRGHSVSLYDETVHIPLIFSYPPLLTPNVKVESQVRSLDIMPTILEVAGIEPPPGIDGRSLFPLVRQADRGTKRGNVDRSIYLELDTWGGTFLHGIRMGGWKLVQNLKIRGRPKTGDELYELYDLTKDPSELDDLYGRDGGRLKSLKKPMARFFSSEAYAKIREQQMDEETIETLKALGYID